MLTLYHVVWAMADPLVVSVDWYLRDLVSDEAFSSVPLDCAHYCCRISRALFS